MLFEQPANVKDILCGLLALAILLFFAASVYWLVRHDLQMTEKTLQLIGQ